MNNDQSAIRDQQRQTWNRFAPNWKKWDDFTMAFLKPMGDAIIDAIAPQPGDHVLDIATGTGEPGLTIAAMVGNGQVTGMDISEGMLEVAQENAHKKGLTNYTTHAGDASSIPFPDNSFDAISCRMGFMFFPDMEAAAREMVRVLKPGGRMATSVWAAPENNPWVTIMMRSIAHYMEMPAPPPGAPGMFRCAAPGQIAGMLQAAGLSSLQEQMIKGKMDYGSPGQYWTNMTEIAAPVVNVLSKATEDQVSAIREEMTRQASPYEKDGKMELDFAALIISGKKP